MKKAKQAKEEKSAQVEEKIEVKKADIDKALELLEGKAVAQEEKTGKKMAAFEKKPLVKTMAKEEPIIISKKEPEMQAKEIQIQNLAEESFVDKESKEARKKKIV